MMPRKLIVLLTGCCALAVPPAALAQDRPVVFVHGLGSSGDSWQGAAARLQTKLAIRAETPNLSSTALYETQAGELQQTVGGLDASVVQVGHSNGGLVARQWSRQHPVSGIVTVGTPHGGAPLVWNLYSYAGFNGGLIGSINDVFRLFGQGCCKWQWILSAYSGLWQTIASLAGSSIAQVAGAVAMNGVFPVTGEMLPGSGFLASINSPANLAREASAIPVRAGVVSTAYNFYWGGALRAAFPDQGDWLAYLRDAARFGMEAYAAYIYANAPYEDWWAFEIASGMMSAAYYLTYMDEWWCQSVSVAGGGACWANDTIVPQWSQVFPAGLVVDTGWQGPAHTQETRMSDAILENLFTNFLSIPPRASAPPPSSPQAVFYEHIDFGGASFGAAGEQAFVGWEWNDRVSSVHVPAGRTVVLYEDADYGGQSLTIAGDDSDLRQHPGPGPDGTWNDAVSAIRVY